MNHHRRHRHHQPTAPLTQSDANCIACDLRYYRTDTPDRCDHASPATRAIHLALMQAGRFGVRDHIYNMGLPMSPQRGNPGC